MYTLYYFPAKKRGRKTEKSQSGLKTANIRQKTCCLDTEIVYTDPQISEILVKYNLSVCYCIVLGRPLDFH